MSGLFWSLFGEDESSGAAAVPDTKHSQAVNPPQRDRSLSSQFFSFFTEETAIEDADANNDVGTIRDSPVAKTLSEMAQSLSDMADETIRTFSPAPVVPPVTPGKISYRRKTVFAPTGHLTEEVVDQTHSATLNIPNSQTSSLHPNSAMEPSANGIHALSIAVPVPENAPSVPTIEEVLPQLPQPPSHDMSHKFPSYRSAKEGKEVPLLTALSRNRGSFRARESTVAQIASKTKTEMEATQEQFTVSNLTGLPSAGSSKVSQLASISEHESQNTDRVTPEFSSVREESLPSVENQPGVLHKYDSENYFGDVVEEEAAPTKRFYTESDDDDVITADLDFEIFKPLQFPESPEPNDNIYFIDSGSSLDCNNSEPANLIGSCCVVFLGI